MQLSLSSLVTRMSSLVTVTLTHYQSQIVFDRAALLDSTFLGEEHLLRIVAETEETELAIQHPDVTPAALHCLSDILNKRVLPLKSQPELAAAGRYLSIPLLEVIAHPLYNQDLAKKMAPHLLRQKKFFRYTYRQLLVVAIENDCDSLLLYLFSQVSPTLYSVHERIFYRNLQWATETRLVRLFQSLRVPFWGDPNAV